MLQTIEHPFPFSVFKTLGRPFAHRGIPSLEPEALIRTALENSRRSSFEDDHFRSHLDVACESANEDARLTILGRIGLRGALINALCNRLLFEQARREHPGRFTTDLVPPIIVLGTPRSGTTLLHRLLGLDPKARTLRYWELRRPFVAQGKKDTRLQIAERETKDFRSLAPHINAKHESTATAPEECLFLFDCTLLSATLWVVAPVYGYLSHYRKADHLRAYQTYEQLLRWFQSEQPNRRLTLKAPSHTPHVKALREVLPQAKLIQLHRDPVRTVASVNSLFYTLHRVVTDDLDVPRMARANLELIAEGVDRCLDYRSENPDHGIVDVYYTDLARDPIATVRRIYEECELPFSNEYERALVNYLNENPQHKHGVHRYDAADFSLTDDEVRDHFQRYRSTFPRITEDSI